MIKIDEHIKFKSSKYPIFKCLRCGDCCLSTPSITMSDVMKLNPGEQDKLELLKDQEVSFPAVVKGGLTIIIEKSPLIISPKTAGDYCIFFENKSCIIHYRKPEECAINPFSVYLTREGDDFIARSFTPNYCEGLTGRRVFNNKLDKELINHLINMIKHEYFILTLKSIPNSISELVNEWTARQAELNSKPLYSMLKLIVQARSREGSRLIFKTCC